MRQRRSTEVERRLAMVVYEVVDGVREASRLMGYSTTAILKWARRAGVVRPRGGSRGGRSYAPGLPHLARLAEVVGCEPVARVCGAHPTHISSVCRRAGLSPFSPREYRSPLRRHFCRGCGRKIRGAGREVRPVGNRGLLCARCAYQRDPSAAAARGLRYRYQRFGKPRWKAGRCEGKTSLGELCCMRPLTASRFCRWHQPEG